jgi:hypothetical protein
MTDNKISNFLAQGYVFGSGRHWEGVCLNLDIAVQGESLDETKALLFEMIGDYLSLASAVPFSEQARMLSRKAPFFVRARYHAAYIRDSLLSRKNIPDRIGFMQHMGSLGMHSPA